MHVCLQHTVLQVLAAQLVLQVCYEALSCSVHLGLRWIIAFSCCLSALADKVRVRNSRYFSDEFREAWVCCMSDRL
jgi:hypothetical protein